jgi:hypothetical protein
MQASMFARDFVGKNKLAKNRSSSKQYAANTIDEESEQ